MTNSFLTGWLEERLALRWQFVFLLLDLLEDWLPAGCGGWLGRLAVCLRLGLGGACRVGWLTVAWRAGRGGGSWAGGPLCGLRCGARPWGGGAETRCALPGAKLRSDSRAKFDVEVRLAAHPPHGLRASPPAKSPPPRPARHTTWVTGWCAQDYSKSRAKSDSCLRFI